MMKQKSKQFGVTLTEMMVVVGAIGLLAYFGVPAVNTFVNSFESPGAARGMLSAAFSSARAIAAKQQRYAGIRFQKAYDSDGLLKAEQYMVFIVHDFDRTGYANGFRAVEGIEPVKLPATVGVMDLRYHLALPGTPGDGVIDTDSEMVNDNVFRDTTAFSVVFSPSGRLVIHNVRISLRNSNDDIFNTLAKITDPVDPAGMFIQDDSAGLGLLEESGRNSFIIYDRKEFKDAYNKGQPYSGYLGKLLPEMVYINPYTGTIISKD